MQHPKRTFLSDAVDMVAMGTRALEYDEFSDCFRPVPHRRMRSGGALYIFSFITRYFILFPLRFALLLAGSLFTGVCFFYGLFTSNESTISCSFNLFFKLFILVFNCHIKHVGTKERLKVPHVYVSNHTSVIDFMILSSYKFCHACISESHGGLFGFIFNTIIAKNGSIAFKRSEKQDRKAVMLRIRKYIQENNTPMLIFPEGTCVNNEYALLFQKGAFELDALICPVGIRYKKYAMDPYWNRRVQCFSLHLLYLMTRWRIDAEVYWLDPMRRGADESAIEFAHRVKSAIASRVGLNNTLWNGYFKSSPVIKDRALFRSAYLSIYMKHRRNILALEADSDATNKRFYLMDENVSKQMDDGRIYLDKFTYSEFIRECCKEYLRLKENKKDENSIANRQTEEVIMVV